MEEFMRVEVRVERYGEVERQLEEIEKRKEGKEGKEGKKDRKDKRDKKDKRERNERRRGVEDGAAEEGDN